MSKRSAAARPAPAAEPLDAFDRRILALYQHDTRIVAEEIGEKVGLSAASVQRRLKRLRARFSRPVFPGQTITTAIWPHSDRGGLKVYAYETENPDGKAVIKDGMVEVATS